MTTSKSRRCRPLPPLLSLAALTVGLAAFPSLAQAQSPAAATQASSARTEPEDLQELYLGVTLNGVQAVQIARFEKSPAGLSASAATLRELGLRWPGSESATGTVPLSRLPGLVAAYDAAGQQLSITVPVSLLDRLPLRLSSGLEPATRIAPQSRLPALLFNYDVFAQSAGGASTLSSFNELRLSGVGPGVWSYSMVTRFSESAGASRQEQVRLDTSWQHDFPDEMISVTVGDTLTSSLSWSRATRIGGVRVSRNFALQPYRVTSPLASFQGEAALPSTVELYINGLRQSSQQVQPGQFQLDSLPSLSGAGLAQLVITDINGQRRAASFDFYGAPNLLQQGLWDWSVEAGFVRGDYGRRSFAYDREPVASASARYGLSDDTTLESHAEASARLHVAGGGAAWRLAGQAGVLSASAAASRSDAGNGRQHSLAYQWNARNYSAAFRTQRNNGEWRDIASRFDGASSRGTDSLYAGFGNFLGQWGMSYVRQLYASQAAARYATLSWSRELPGHSTLSVNMSKDLGAGGNTNIYLFWSMPLEERRTISAGVSHQAGGGRLTLDAAQSAPGNGEGWGVRVQASTDQAGIGGQAQVTRTSSIGQWGAGVARNGAGSPATIYGSSSGSVLWAGGGLHAMRRADDAFALVSTDGVADVPVRLENRLVGRTDAKGQLLVSQLSAYQRNQLAIDTLELPADMRAERVTADAVPQSRSGALVRFGLRRVSAVQLSLRDPRGHMLPAGSAVWLDGDDTALPRSGEPYTVVGHEGLVYLEDPPANAALHVETPAGACTVPLPDRLSPGLSDLGLLICHP